MVGVLTSPVALCSFRSLLDRTIVSMVGTPFFFLIYFIYLYVVLGESLYIAICQKLIE
jgi:hypothetical protein